MSQKVQIVFDAKMDVANLKSGLQQFQTGLASLSMPKNMGAELEKRLNKLNSEIRNFESLSEKAGNSLDSAGKINSSYGKIVEYARQLEITFKKIGEEAGIDASKFFPKEIITKIEGAEKAMEGYKQAVADGLKGLKDQVNEAKKLEQVLDKAKKDLSGAKKTQGLREQRLTGAKARQAQTNTEVSERQGKIDTRKKEINARTEAINKEIEAINKRKKALQDEETAAKNNLKTLQDKSNTSVKQETKDKYAPLIKEQTKAWNEAKQAKDNYINSHSTKQLESELQSLSDEFKSLTQVEKGLTTELNSVNKAVTDAQTAYDSAADDVTFFEGEVKKAEQASNSFNTALENQKKTIEGNALKTLVQELQKIGIAVDPAVTDLQDIEKTLNQLQPQALNQIEKALEKAGTSLKDFNVDLDRLGTKNSTLKQTADDAMKMSNQFNDLKNQVQYFFSLTNSVQLLQRAVRSAFETVKELDAAMTETAVVTDFSVGDMWDQLPRYTQAANELGTTTKGAYETMTLFYQQGLDTNEAFAIGTETMKMARIAGLDYANATNLMTAALRGFNMELNETSATRINDVYSELAAITAADTQEIATAMTKTASIAANANMEFETTAALLSQIIETTREPAETAGTAMKTIIARFTEMKKSASEVINVDGEEVNVNKVEAALKSAGVALRDTKGEFRDLDDVFLELSSKWNGLDMMTQRYVATMAAGSRQQSRFIAMMSDYDRTLELVDAAYNSSGASQKQFEKTQDSLESKLNKLTNAWNEFLMGISNSSVIKGAVDLLTGILNVVNKVTGAFGEGAGGVLKLGAAMAGLKVGSAVLNKGLQKAAVLASSFQKGDNNKTGFLSGLTQKINNFTSGKAFVIDADINTKGIENKINNVKSQWSNLKTSLTKTVEVKSDSAKTVVAFKAIDGALATTTITSKAMGEALELNLSEVGTKAILASQGVEEITEEMTELGISGSAVLEILEKKYDELIAKGEMVEAAQILGDMGSIQAAENAGIKTKNAFLNQIKQTGTKAGTLITTGLSKFAGLFGASGAAAGAAIAGGIIAAVGAVVGTIYATWYNSAVETSKRVAKAHEASLKETQTNLDYTKKAINDVEEAWDQLTESNNTLDGLIQGTQEWNDQLRAINDQVRDLLEKYPELYKYLNIDLTTGQMSISEKGKDEYINSKRNEESNLTYTKGVQKALSDYSSGMADNIKKTTDKDDLASWTYNQEALETEYYASLVRAYAWANDDGSDGVKGIGNYNTMRAAIEAGALTETEIPTIEEILNDDKTIKYIEGIREGKNGGSDIWEAGLVGEGSRALGHRSQGFKGTSGVSDPRAALEYYEEKARLEEEAKASIAANVQSYLVEQGYTGNTAKAAYNVYSQGTDYFEEYRDKTTFDGKTGGEGLNDREGGWDEAVIAIMEKQGYKLDDSATNTFINEEGKKVNVNRVGGGAPGEKTKDGVEIWSDEYLADLELQNKIIEDSKAQAKKNADFFNKHPELATAFSGDLSANLEEYTTSKDGKIYKNGTEVTGGIVTASQIEDFKKDRNTSLSELYQKYSLGEKENYNQKDYEFAQELLNFEKSVSGLGEKTAQNLTETFIILEDLRNSSLGLETALDNTGEKGKQLEETFKNSTVSAEGFANYINGIDMSSAINGARQLHQSLKEGGDEAIYAAQVLANDETGDGFFSAGNQFKEMIGSESWKDTEEALSNIYTISGKITADNIRELKEENAELASVLDTNSLKASGFAKMMEAVEEGTVSLASVTTDLIKVYDSLYYSADLAGEAIARLESVEIGDSDTKIGNIYSESWAAVQDLIDRGAAGDSQIDDYMHQMVGEVAWNDALTKSGGDKEKAKETIDKQYGLSENDGNLYGSWTHAINKGQTAGGVFSMGADGQINYNLSGISSTKELVDKMTVDNGGNREWAETMLADLKTYSKTLGSDLDDLDKRGTSKEFRQTRTTGSGDTKTLNASDAELSAFAKAKNMTLDEYKKYLKDEKGYKKIEDREYGKTGYTYNVTDKDGVTKTQFTEGALEKIKEQVKSFDTEIKDGKQQASDKQLTVKANVELNEEQLKTKLNAALEIDAVREIILSPVPDTDKKQLLAEMGIENETLITHLLSPDAKQQAENYGVDLYNSIGENIEAALNILRDFAVTIPINFSMPIHVPKMEGLAGAIFPEQDITITGTDGELTIGGEGTGMAGGGFTPKGYSAPAGDTSGDEGDKDDDDDDDGSGYPEGDDPNNGADGGSGDKFEPENWAAYNEDQRLAALERQRATNDREAELISKLPQEIQGPLQLLNLGEDMMYEAQEIQINKNKLEALQLERGNLEAEHSDVLNSGAVYYDEQLQSYMYNNDIMKGLDTEGQKKAQEAMTALSEVSNKINEVSDQLDGGKVQKFIRAFEKGTKGVSKVLKEEDKTVKNVNKAFDLLEKKLGLNEKTFDKFADGIANAIDNSDALNATFEGLNDEGDALVDQLEKSPLGKMLGESAKPVFDLLKNGGTNRQMGGALAGLGGDMLGKLGDFANFDMMSMALDGANMMKGMMDQGKQMMEQAAQYICQAIQVVVDAITNREDILFNYLNLIEKELQNYEKLQRYSTQLEKGRLASSEEIALNWDAQWESLQKQLEMQEFRVEQRQQQLEMSRWIPFQLISGWDPTSDTLYENREVKFAWDLLIGFGQMMPMFGQVFGSLNQLYEDYDKRVTEAYEDRLEAEQAILDIQDERLELVKVGSEEATEFEEKILEALVQKEQEAIDELTSINESITDANSKLLSTLQDKLDKLREQRENEKMEEELGEKERRLAYFRQNTGQGKLMDIKKLEEELEEGHESYTDQLIDQRIADLEKQNEKAAEQREKQIDLMQAQLDWSEKYGLYWDQIYGMLYVINDDGTVSMNLDNFDLEGNLRTNGELSTLINTFSDNIGKSIWSQLLENEELMRLGRYYQAFISRNGVTGEWGKYWALLNPGQDDPANAYVNPWDSRDVGFLLKGILAIENAINKYFILSDYGLANMAGRIEAAFKNVIGKLFGIEEWANYKFEGYRADHVNAPISEGLYDIGAAIGIYEKEPDNSTYKSYGAETGNRISKTENIKDTMYDIDLYIGEIFDSTGDAIDALTGFFADLFSTVHNVL